MHLLKDCEWTPRYNLLNLYCTACSKTFMHRADRWISICPACGERDNLENVRNNFMRSQQKETELDELTQGGLICH